MKGTLKVNLHPGNPRRDPSLRTRRQYASISKNPRVPGNEKGAAQGKVGLAIAVGCLLPLLVEALAAAGVVIYFRSLSPDPAPPMAPSPLAPPPTAWVPQRD